MTDYYIPLSEITGTLGLGNLPGVAGDFFERLFESIGVRSWNESWNDTDCVTTGTGVLATEVPPLEMGSVALVLGDPTSGTTQFDFELIRDRSSLLDTALSLAGEVDNVSTLDDNLQVFFRSDGPPRYLRLVIRGLGLRLRFDRDRVRKGKLVTDAQGVKTIEAVSGDDTADIQILPAAIVFDTRLSYFVDLVPDFDDDQLVDVPPLRIFGEHDQGEPLFNVLASKVKFDLSTETAFPEALIHGYDETWQGVYFAELAILGLDKIFPVLPKSVDATNWFLGTDGITGAVSVSFAGGDWFKDLTFELELDKDRLVKAGGELTVVVSKLDTSFGSLGPNGDLLFGFSMRFNPAGGTLFEAVLRTPHPADPNNDIGLLTLKDDVADVFPALLFILGLEGLDLGAVPGGVNIAIWLIALFTVVDFFDFKAVTLDAIAVRRRPTPLAGRTLYWLDFVLDVRIKLGLNIRLGNVLIPDIKTKPDHPLTLVLKGFTFAVATNLDDFTDTERGDIGGYDILFDPKSEVSFNVGDETLVEKSPFIVTKAAVGRWDKGMWLELGFKVSIGDSPKETSYSIVPSIIRIYFLDNFDVDHVDLVGASFSLQVPQVLYARGEWSAGEVSKVTGKVMVLGWAESRAHPEDPKNWMLVAGFGMQEQDMPPPPAPKEATSRLLFFELESSSGLPLLGATALYGISALHAQNARPAIGSGTPAQWLTERNPKYQVGVDKWEAAVDNSGFAAGAIIGASTDRGRPWNLKAGFLYSNPGPVIMLFGTANWLNERKGLKETSPAALNFNAVLDLARHEFLLGVRYDKKIPDSTGRVLKLSVPGEIFVSGHDWHIYLGKDKPAERMTTAELFSRYQIAAYIMVDTETIANLAETGVDIPGTALAVGARFEMEGGRKGSHYKLVFYLKVAADFAASLNDPTLTLLRGRLAGGLVVKAWGIGFEFELSAEGTWIRPVPDYLKYILSVTIDLPWPIPNLHLSIEQSSGADGEGEPLSGSLVDGLSLFNTTTQEVTEVTEPVPDVPLNPIFSLAFKYPTRNDAVVPGSFNLSGANGSTFYYVGGETGGERGYAITLESVSLFKIVAGTPVLVPGPFPALWRPTPVTAAGGQVDHRILELFGYDGITASRFIGASADYVEWATQGFDPCPPGDFPEPVCYGFDDQPLGVLDSELSVSVPAPASDPRRIVVRMLAEDAEAELLRRYLGTNAYPAEVVACPIPGLAARVIRLPSNDGADPPAAAGGRLEIACAKANEVDVTVLRFPRGSVKVTAWFGDQLIDTDEVGEVLDHIGEDRFELVRYHLAGPLNRLTFETAHRTGFSRTRSLVVKVCVLYAADVDRWNDQQAYGIAWSTFWSDLLSQDAAASNALVLEPATEYRLEVKANWAHRHEDGSLSSPNGATATYSFTTTAQPPQTLRGPMAALDDTDWEVRTTPGDGAVGVYTERPIRMEFRDARTDKVFGAFGQRLILRFTDSNGLDLFDQLDVIRQTATALPPYQQAWKSAIAGLVCVPSGVEALWSIGSAHFPSVLVRQQRYNGTLVMLPAAITDLATVQDWEQYPVIYGFRFTTSRYATAAAHLAAHRIFDEVCEQDPDIAGAQAAIGPQPAGGQRTDGPLLEAVLNGHLHLSARPCPLEPEIVRIWQRTSVNGFSLIGLLIDGPEPLVKATADTVGVAGVPLRRLDRDDGSRILLLFDAPAVPGTLSFSLTSWFEDANGQPASESASRFLEVPVVPPVFAPEPAP